MLAGMEIALQGIREDAIADACFRFMTGQVAGQNISFAPSIPQLVVEARDRQEMIGCLERYANAPALPEPSVAVSKPVPAEWMDALTDKMAGKIDAAQFTAITGIHWSEAEQAKSGA